MKASRILLAVVAAFAAFVTFAETLVFAPGNGVTTNVTERLAAGVDVQANEGASGGGIVNLMNAENGAIGTAAVKCGTLGFENITRSSIGTLSLGNGTFRYRGAEPATANMKVVLDTAALDDAGVIWCDGDLKTIGTFDVNNGALIKAGPGSFTLATASRPDGQRQLLARSVAGRNWNWIMNMKANGDSPTQAYANLTVREGHFVIDTAPGVETVLGPTANSFNYSAYVMCGERSGATEPGSEPYGHLDIRNGTVYLNSSILVGYYNGNPTTRPDATSGSSFNIYGGTVKSSASAKIWVGELYNISEARSGLPSFNVYGGTISKFEEVLLARNRGARGRFFLSGTTFATSNLKCADKNGGTSADDEIIPLAEVHVCSNGVLAADTINPCAKGFCDFSLKVTDGGTLRLDRAIAPTAAYATSPMRLILDGGTIELAGTGYDIVPSGFVTRLGPQQSTIAVTGTGAYAFSGPVATDDALVPSCSTDGGLKIGGKSETTVAFAGGMTISGPVIVDKNAKLRFLDDASVGALAAEDDDASFAFVWNGSRFATLTAGGWNVPGTVRISFDGTWSAGTYDLVSMPSDATVDLSHVVLNAASDAADATFATRTENGRVILSVTLAARTVASFVWDNPAGGVWSDGSNWGDGSGDAPSGTDARAVFSTAADAQGTAVTLASGVTLGGMTLSAEPGYALSGATITLDNAGGPATVAATAGSSEIAAPVAMAGETYLNAASGASLEVSGAISGYGPLTVNASGGSGLVTLSGANTFATAPCVKAGTMRVTTVADTGSASAAGAGSAIRVGTAVFEYAGTAAGATDRTFELAAAANAKSAIGAAEGSTLTVNGAVNVASDTVFAKSGAGTVVLNGFVGYNFPHGVAVDEGTLALNGGPATVHEQFAMTVASGAALALTGSGILHARVLTGAGSVLWNGGIWYPSFGHANIYGVTAFSVASSFIGANGAMIDLSDMADQDLPLGGAWATADGVATDGGIVISSSHPATNNKLMSVSFLPTATYGFSGPVTLASGGVAKTTGAALAANSVVVQADGAIAAAMSGSAAQEANVKSLTLAAGSSVFSYVSGAGVCATLRATDSLSVGGTVYVALCSGTGIPDLATTAGTYAILRGPKGTLDASKFAMSLRYASANGTFALDTSSPDYDQVDLTLASASTYNSQTQMDFRRDFVWTAGSGSWSDAANWECGLVPYDSYVSRMRAIFPSTVADGTRVSLGGNRIVEVLETAVPGDLWLTDGTMNARGSGEYAFIKTTAGTLHLPDALFDEWRWQYMDTASCATQIVEGVLSDVKQAVYVNNLVRPGGMVRATRGTVHHFNVYSGTLAVAPELLDRNTSNIDNCTLSLVESGDVLAGIAGSNGMNLRVEAGEEVFFWNNVSCLGPFIKTGAGTAYLGGSGSVTLGNSVRNNADNIYSTAATEIPANGDLPQSGLTSLAVAAGKLVLGLDERQSITVSGSGAGLHVGQYIADFDENGDVLDSELEILGGNVQVWGDVNIGRNAGAYRLRRDSGEKKRNLTLTVRGGRLNFNGSFYMVSDNQAYYNGTATFNLHGGTVTSSGQYVNMAYTRTTHVEHGYAKSVVNVYGGMFTNTVTELKLNPGGAGNIEINLYGGDFAWTAPFKFDGGNSMFTGNINFHGGTFTAPYITRNYGGGNHSFYFNGGSYRPTQDGASLRMNANYPWTSVVVSTNGAAFDIPGANTFTLNQAFTHDAALGAVRDGGIRKRGTGTLLLTVANTFTGPCVAEGGVMRPTVAAAVSGGVGASGYGVFDMNGFDLTVPELVGEGGRVANGTLTVTERIATETFVAVEDVEISEGVTFASNLENYIRVLSSAAGSLVVDFGRDASDPLPKGLAVKVAEMPSGSSIAISGVNTGREGRWEVVGERRNESNGMVEVWAVLRPIGSALILR